MRLDADGRHATAERLLALGSNWRVRPIAAVQVVMANWRIRLISDIRSRRQSGRFPLGAGRTSLKPPVRSPDRHRGARQYAFEESPNDLRTGRAEADVQTRARGAVRALALATAGRRDLDINRLLAFSGDPL